MAVKLKDIRVGGHVMVRPGFGSQPAVKGKVTAVHQDVKNGRPGIDYEVGEASNWAYLYQVDRVID